jgi:sigma-B regulation protein RsbU (phosphoserine phosphatase)
VKGERSEGKEDVELHAVLLPMREVGGDLYDFHREGDKLWFIIGDVSGKGVPAAIFMSAAVNLFRAAGVRANSPKGIVEEMNAVLSENNPSMTFVTAFVGCLRIPTGELIYCNAGHCAPLKVKGERGKVKGERGKVKGEKGKMKGERQKTIVESLQMEPNIPLGLDGHYSFVEQGCMLGEGDTLVLYTDGVTEARNPEREMLGMEQWKEIIKSGKWEADDLLGEVKSFIGTGEQADDITLMTIRKTSAVEPLVVRVENKLDHWPVLRCALHGYGVCAGMNARGLKMIELAVEEAVVNIINYSQAEWVELEVKVKKGINVTLRDNGIAFDPTAHVPNEKATDERQVGGMGIHLIRQIVDEIRYERKDERNILGLVKKISS